MARRERGRDLIGERDRQEPPVMPAIRVSALDTDAVTDGCLAVGTELAWAQVMTALPTAP